MVYFLDLFSVCSKLIFHHIRKFNSTQHRKSLLLSLTLEQFQPTVHISYSAYQYILGRQKYIHAYIILLKLHFSELISNTSHHITSQTPFPQAYFLVNAKVLGRN